MKKTLSIKNAILSIFSLLLIAYSQYGFATIRLYTANPDLEHLTEVQMAEAHTINTDKIGQEDAIFLTMLLQEKKVAKTKFVNVSFCPGTLRTITEFLNRYTDQPQTALTILNSAIGNEQMQEITSILNTDGRLTSLTLNNCHIDHQAGPILARCLEQNRTLKHLDLRFNAIDGEGFEHFAHALSHNKTLNHLDLRYNNITDDYIMGELTKAFAENVGLNTFYYWEGNSDGGPRKEDRYFCDVLVLRLYPLKNFDLPASKRQIIQPIVPIILARNELIATPRFQQAINRIQPKYQDSSLFKKIAESKKAFHGKVYWILNATEKQFDRLSFSSPEDIAPLRELRELHNKIMHHFSHDPTLRRDCHDYLVQSLATDAKFIEQFFPELQHN